MAKLTVVERRYLDDKLKRIINNKKIDISRGVREHYPNFKDTDAISLYNDLSKAGVKVCEELIKNGDYTATLEVNKYNRLEVYLHFEVLEIERNTMLKIIASKTNLLDIKYQDAKDRIYLGDSKDALALIEEFKNL